MYDYKAEKQKLFTEEAQADFLKVRDHVLKTLKMAGAIRMQEAMIGDGDPWMQLAMIDRMVELGELRELTVQGMVAVQHRVFVAA